MAEVARSWVRRAFLLLFAFALLQPAAAGEPQPVVAVFEIQDNAANLSGADRDQLTDYLSTRLGEGGVFQVVPRLTIKKRLSQTKSASYRSCYDVSCQVELGRELAASKIVSARLLKIGDQCQLTLQIYDLKIAATEKAATIKTRCDPGSLPRAIDLAVVQVGGRPNLSAIMGSADSAEGLGMVQPCAPPKIFIAGNCCWPGQDWGVVSQRCVGTPNCPMGYTLTRGDCVPNCPDGKTLVAGHCCWPGQDWGYKSEKCLGKRNCPPGLYPTENECLQPGSEGYQDHVRASMLSCLRACEVVPTDQQDVTKCMQDKLQLCTKERRKPLDCGVDLEACIQWCKKYPTKRGYCIESCRDSYDRELEKCQINRQLCSARCRSKLTPSDQPVVE